MSIKEHDDVSKIEGIITKLQTALSQSKVSVKLPVESMKMKMYAIVKNKPYDKYKTELQTYLINELLNIKIKPDKALSAVNGAIRMLDPFAFPHKQHGFFKKETTKKKVEETVRPTQKQSASKK